MESGRTEAESLEMGDIESKPGPSRGRTNAGNGGEPFDRNAGVLEGAAAALRGAYREARSVNFEFEAVESMDLEEPDLYFRHAIRRRGRPPVPVPGPRTVPRLGSIDAGDDETDEVIYPTWTSADANPDGVVGHMEAETLARKAIETLARTTKLATKAGEAPPTEKPVRSPLFEHWRRFVDDFSRYVLIIFLATLVACVYKFIFWTSEHALEWRIGLMEHFLGIVEEEGGGSAHRRLLKRVAGGLGLSGRAETPSHVNHYEGEMVDPNYAAAYFTAVGTSLLFVLPAAFLIGMLKPAAAGAGMPEVIAFLNGNLQTRAYELSTLILKIVGSVCIVASGLLSGFDGPMIHIGSILAYLMTTWIWKSDTFGLKGMGLGTRHFGVTLRRHQPADHATIRRRATAHEFEEVRDSELQKKTLDFATLGACAAFSAAFRSPLAAVTLALEEAITHFDPSFISRAMLVSLWAFFMLSFLSKIDWLNPFSFSIFAVNANCTVRTEYVDILIWTIMGLLAGIGGHLYNISVTWIRLLRTRLTWPARPWRALADVCVVVVISMAVIVLLPLAFDTCTPKSTSLQHMANERGNCEITCTKSGNNSYIAINPMCPFLQDETVVGARICLPDEVNRELIYKIGIDVRTAAIICDTPESGPFVWSPFNDTSIDSLAMTLHMPSMVSGMRPVNATVEPCVYQMRSLLWKIPEQVLQNLSLRGLYGLFDWHVLLVFAFAYSLLSVIVNGIVLPTDLVIPNLIIGAAFGRLIGLGINYFKVRGGSIFVDPGLYAQLGMAAFWAGTSRMSITVALVALETAFELTYIPAILTVVTVATITGNALGPSLYHMEIENRKIPYLEIEPSQHAKKTLSRAPVSAIMASPTAVIVGMKPLYGDLERLLAESPKISGFPIVDEEGGLLAMVLRRRVENLLDSLPDGFSAAVDLSTILNPSPTAVPSTISVLKAFTTFRDLKLRHMIVVDSLASGKVVGMVTRRDLIAAEHAAAEGHLTADGTPLEHESPDATVPRRDLASRIGGLM